MDAETPTRLVRPVEGRRIAGVAAGLADHFNIEVNWVRAGFIVAAVFGAAGVVAYLALWLLMPSEDETMPHMEIGAWIRNPIAWLLVAVAIFAANDEIWDNDFILAAALVALGILIYRDREVRFSITRDSDEVEQEVHGEIAETQDRTSPSRGRAITSARRRPRAEVRRPPRERSPLGRLTIGVLLIAEGCLWLANDAGVVEVPLRAYFAAALLAIGAGLLIGARWGRARGLIVLAFMLLPLVVASSFIDVPVSGGFGSRTIAPTAGAPVAPSYDLAAGTLTLVMRRVEQAAGHVRVTVAAGILRVYTPKGVPVDVRARVGVGTIWIVGATQAYEQGGANLDVRRHIGPLKGDALTLDLETSIGRVEVYA